MSRGTCLWDFPKSPADYKAWVTGLGRACSQRLKSARPTSGAGSSYWPTPLVQMGGNKPDLYAGGEGMRVKVYLRQVGRQVALMEVSKAWTTLWLFVKSLGFRAGLMPPYRFSLPLHVTLWPGSRYSNGTLTFNPAFSDLMMGWPIGWSDPNSQVMGFAHWLRRSRIALCRMAGPCDTPCGHAAGE